MALALIPLSCAAMLLGLAARAVAAEAPSGNGFQLDLAAGIGRDGSTSQGGFSETDTAFTAGIGMALLHGPLTVGVRLEHAPLLFSHDSNFYLAEVGAHGRAGMFKLSALAEIGAHHFIDVGSGLFEPDTSNSTMLPSLGLRGSIDLAPRRLAPTIGWWVAYRHDLESARVAAPNGTFDIGGSFLATGLQVGLDLQP